MPDETKHKNIDVIKSIKRNTRLITFITILTVFTVLLVNTRIMSTMLDYLPSRSIVTMLIIVSGLVLIGFYLTRKISMNAINNLVEELTKRQVVEENLKKANEELENQVNERTAELSRTVILLKENIEKRKQMEEQLYNLSITDELTGLYNRRGFFTLADHRLKIAKRQNIGLLLLYADIDNLKNINDTLGHEEGDKLLIEIANILKRNYRDTDIITRIGGDEFVVYPVGTTNDHSDIITSRLQKNIDIHNEKREHSCKLSLSIGIAGYNPESVQTIDGLLTEADKLMYEQKRNKQSS